MPRRDMAVFDVDNPLYDTEAAFPKILPSPIHPLPVLMNMSFG